MICTECGFGNCELAWTNGEYPLCCDCWQKSGASEVAECYGCEIHRKNKEKILKQQMKLTEFINAEIL